MSERKDFEVPPGTESGVCRLCRREILWVPGARGMMPLDTASAILVQKDGRTIKRAESHFAHCPKAEHARRSRPKALCRIRECGTSISRTRHFCPPCSARAPRSLRSLLKSTADEHGASSPETRRVLARVLQKILESRAADKVSAPSLFGNSAAPPDDPG